MIKHAVAMLLAATSLSTRAADSVTLPLIIQMQNLANASMCESFKGDASPLGKAMNQQCRHRERAEFEAMQDAKTLKDCIKPGNIIDDGVRKCRKGI
ncbi:MULTISPECIES: hypothetical protein [unclassified Pseudomonas]|uniref:hypothetical protein n=1 Tax=unclassified Pseudomonas TaxID=196821 RepID=UPI0025E6FFE5|nr:MULTISPECIES: hypothetical protein [unclassified Pseudomonas]